MQLSHQPECFHHKEQRESDGERDWNAQVDQHGPCRWLVNGAYRPAQ